MKNEIPPTLKIVIKAKWFDEIATKRKQIEYRDVSPFWISRLYDKAGKKRHYEYIEFINGYNPTARRVITKYEGFNKKGNLFHIKIGAIIKKK